MAGRIALGEMLRKARKSLGKSIQDFAPDLEVSPNTLGGYERKENLPDLEFLALFASQAGVEFSELLQARIDAMQISGMSKLPRGLAENQAFYGAGDEFTEIPRYEARAGAAKGGAIVDRDNIKDYLVYRTAWLRETLHVPLDKLAIFDAWGDSMQPTILEGDVLLVELDPERLIEGAIYILELDGMRKVKRIQQSSDGTLIVTSDNPGYEPDRIPKNRVDDVHIIGRVRWIGRTF
jgi:phage repressor protein C with HTH and peptisase S24 domain